MTGGSTVLTTHGGNITVARLTLPPQNISSVTLDGASIEFHVEEDAVVFAAPVTLTSGSCLMLM